MRPSTVIDFPALLADQPRTTTNEGAIIVLIDNLPPEVTAMLQAKLSRQPGGYDKNTEGLVGMSSVEKFMGIFFVGYGHKSIGDCGSTTLTWNGVSMLAAKALEHWPLFNGQETSTRYVDVTNLSFVVPPGAGDIGHTLMEKCFALYHKSFEPLIQHLKVTFPLEDGQDVEKYDKTIQARAYDILGSLLPAGAKTNVSIHMNLRQMREHLCYLVHHPLEEIRTLAQSSLDLLVKQYPGSFKDLGIHEEREAYRREFMTDLYYDNDAEEYRELNPIQMTVLRPMKPSEERFLKNRNMRIELPHLFNQIANFSGLYTIDFRSYRDIERQRSMNQTLPLLTTRLGFGNWYLNQMPEKLRAEVGSFLADYRIAIEEIGISPSNLQYLIPMGYKVHVVFSVGLAHMIYIMELRSQTTVHPTVRNLVHPWAHYFKSVFPNIPLYADMDPKDFNLKRADQTITEKK